MQPRFTALFLVAAAAVVFHLPTTTMFVVILGYLVFEQLDNVLVRRTKIKAVDQVIADELYGWTVSPDDPNRELKDESERVRLTGKDQITVTRIAELIRRLHMS